MLGIEGTHVKIEVTMDLSRSLLTSEENIQEGLNEADCIATVAALKYLDRDGSPLEMAGEVMRTKGEQPKPYQTPYGEVIVNRQVYQRSCGGKTYCPLERDGRIIMTSTPFFCMLMCETGWREAMVGTISLYDIAGERQHFLNPHTSTQILDFYHA